MIDISIDTTNLTADLEALATRQFPFAAAQALNRTAEEAQARMQLEIHAKLAVRSSRSATFLEQMVKFDRADRATKEKLEARIHVAGPNSDEAKGELLLRNVFGSSSTMPGGPLSSFFIPADATRPGRMMVVPQSLYPKNLRLMDRLAPSGMLYAKRHITRTGAVQLKGKQRTFVLVKDGRPLGIYQREGPHDIQLLWFYSSHVDVPSRLDFLGIAERTFSERFLDNFEGMLGNALASARGAGLVADGVSRG